MKKTMEFTSQTTGQAVRVEMEYRKGYEIIEINLDGHIFSESKITESSQVVLYLDNKMVARSYEPWIITEENRTVFFAKAPVGALILGNMCMSNLDVAAAWLALKVEGNEVSDVDANEAKEIQKKKIKRATKIVEESEKRTDRILSRKDENAWRTSYNNLNNEGGEGYIPARITLEDVAEAKKNS